MQHEAGRERRRVKTLRRAKPVPGKDDGRGDNPGDGERAGQDPAGVGDEEGSSDEDSDFVFEDPDHLGELTALAWCRDDRPPGVSTDGPPEVGAGRGEDPLARALRHNVPVYRGHHSRAWHAPITAPW